MKLGIILFSLFGLVLVSCLTYAANYDFNFRTVSVITSTVGKPFDLKVDVGNTGTLSDSYRVGFIASPAGLVGVSDATLTTDTTNPNSVASVYTIITPLVNQNSIITVTVTSVNCGGSCLSKSVDIPVRAGLFSLPEFDITGFITIMIVAAIVYYLITSEIIKPKRK